MNFDKPRNNQIDRKTARDELGRLYELMDNNNRAMDAFADLLGTCNNEVNTENLFYLIDPIIRNNMQLAKDMWEIGKRLV